MFRPFLIRPSSGGGGGGGGGCVQAQRLRCFAHINTMPETNIVKKIYKWKPFTRRPVGRPKSRWEDDVRNDLKKMKPMKRAGQVQDGLKWKDIVQKTKTVPEL